MDRLRILAPTRYPWLFNGPHASKHLIERRLFLPINKICKRFEALTVFNPWPLQHFDLVHGFNRIPLGKLPFVIGFESHLPRAFGLEKTRYFHWITRILAGPRCKRIIAISDHARRIFLATHAGSPFADVLAKKLTVHYPNIEIPDIPDQMADAPPLPVKVVFVGNHFGRKGGCVAARLAQIAIERYFPLEVHVVSCLEAGGGIWTDPLRSDFFNPYFALLKLPNVRHYGSLPNAEVRELMQKAHFSLLTTFSDTFGFSAIESMAYWTPVIGTRQSALQEFIEHSVNGILLDLPLNEMGDWLYSATTERDSQAFEKIYKEEIERMAHEAFAIIVELSHAPDKMSAMRAAARKTAVELFNANEANEYWDEVYEMAMSN
jgi:glycosyltransferase involved in cell wall biosynthesis